MHGEIMGMDRSNLATPIGAAIRKQRQALGWKLGAVSRHVPIATLSAIERGQTIPSLATLDAITAGLGLSVGSFDLILLQSVRNVEQALAVLGRLWQHESWLTTQQILRQRARQASTARDRWIARWLLVRHLERRQRWQRITVMLSRLVQDPGMIPSLRSEALALLGRAYLLAGRPYDAAGPLLLAVEDTNHHDVWESSLCNLGLVWWKIGHYDEAAGVWEQAVHMVTDPKRHAMAWTGLGNVAARRERWREAQKAYQEAFQIYHTADASATERVRVLNNLLWCSIRQKAWDMAETIMAEAKKEGTCDPIVYGEFLATQAELAGTRGEKARCMALCGEAKAWLKDALVVSWFTVRVIELEASQPPVAVWRQRVAELDQRLDEVPSPRWALHVHSVVARAALAAGHLDIATARLARIEHLSETL